MRILSSKAFTFAQASLGLGKESSAPPTLAKNRPSAHRRADIFLKECMTWRRTGRLIAGGAMKGCKCPFTGTRRRLPPPNSSLAAILRSFLQAKRARSEEHTSELQSLMRSSYAVFCLKKKK